MTLSAGLNSVTFRSLGVDDIVELAADAGLVGIEWSGDVHTPPGDPKAARRAARLCADHGLGVPSLGSYVFARTWPDDRTLTADGRSQDFGAALDTASELGCLTIRVWAGTRPSADTPPDRRRAVAEQLHAFAVLAATHGITVATECHAWTLTDSSASTVELLDEAAHPNLRTHWQPRYGGVPSDDLAELDAVADRLAHLHVFWWDGDAQRHPLAEGADLWAPALRRAAAVDDGTADRFALLEFVPDDDPAVLAREARVLTNWLTEALRVDGPDG